MVEIYHYLCLLPLSCLLLTLDFAQLPEMFIKVLVDRQPGDETADHSADKTAPKPELRPDDAQRQSA
jgi:hypothetical protein